MSFLLNLYKFIYLFFFIVDINRIYSRASIRGRQPISVQDNLFIDIVKNCKKLSISTNKFIHSYLRLSKILKDEVYLFWCEVSWCVCVPSLKESYLQRNAFVYPFVQCAHRTAVAEVWAVSHGKSFLCRVLHYGKIVFVVDVVNRFDKTLQNLKNRDIQMIIKKIKKRGSSER